jgi:hypothetical protein
MESVMTEDDAGVQGREINRPALDVACLHHNSHRAALVSTTGNHCWVWRSNQKPADGGPAPDETYLEYVIKYPKERYDDSDARILARQHRELRDRLGEFVPQAIYVVSCIDGQPNLFVIAQAVDIWFNIANPSNREESIGLLSENRVARRQLRTFVDQARAWRQGPNPKVIDLYGLDNLVMDKDHHIRYVDSYYVFFFEDMLHLLGGDRDYELEEKIERSLRRLAYLEEILAIAEAGGNEA